VSSKKRRPRRVLIALRGRIDPVVSENVRDRAAPDLMPQIGHCSLDPCVPPQSILKRHAQNEIDDRLHDARPAGTSPMAVVPSACDQFSVPSQKGIRRDQGTKFVQDVSFELLDITGSRFAIFYGLAAVKTALSWPSLRLAAGPARLAA
jgi:hypothetical protein